MNKIYTLQDWERDGTLKVQIGQCIDDTVFENLLNSVPPITYKSYCFQPGEAWSHYKGQPLYLTFVKANEGWLYKGLCFRGQNQPIQESKNTKTTINEIGDTSKGQYAIGAVAGKYVGDEKSKKYINKSLEKSIDTLKKDSNEKDFHDRTNAFIDGCKYGINKKLKISESELYDLIKESVNFILKEEFYTKYPSPYDDTKKGNGQTKPLKDNIYLDSVRARIGNILQSINNNNIEAAKKQLLRLYKLVDAMINQS